VKPLKGDDEIMDIKGQARQLRRQGLSVRETARRLGVSKSAGGKWTKGATSAGEVAARAVAPVSDIEARRPKGRGTRAALAGCRPQSANSLQSQPRAEGISPSTLKPWPCCGHTGHDSWSTACGWGMPIRTTTWSSPDLWEGLLTPRC